MIQTDLFLALATFAFVSSVTPGPNNLMLMASGANHGLLRTLPHMAGVALGFTAMVLLVGVGVMQLFEAVPWLRTVLSGIGAAYLLWLALHIARAAPPEDSREAGRPLSFFQAALFQWVNPKAWTMALTALTLYAPGRTLAAVALVAAVFGAINLPSVGVWAYLGTRIRSLLRDPRRLRIFNRTMALLLVASLVPAFLHP